MPSLSASTKPSTRETALNAAICATPSGFTAPCSTSMPKYVTACCTPETAPNHSVWRSSGALTRVHDSGTSAGIRSFIYRKDSSAETACASTEAAAAPSTPSPRSRTKKTESATFSSEAAIRKTSGAADSPTARIANDRRL